LFIRQNIKNMAKVKNVAKCGKSEKCGKNVARSSKMWQMPHKWGKRVTLSYMIL
jgi:hypothetical protein